MIVVDTNVIAYLMIEGEKTELAQRTLQTDPQWVLPQLWRHEFLNVLAIFVQYGGGQLADAIRIWQDCFARFASREQDVNLAAALEVATQNGISAYDAQYVTLAMALNIPLITEDRKLHRAFPRIAQSMQQFCQE